MSNPHTISPLISLNQKLQEVKDQVTRVEVRLDELDQTSNDSKAEGGSRLDNEIFAPVDIPENSMIAETTQEETVGRVTPPQIPPSRNNNSTNSPGDDAALRRAISHVQDRAYDEVLQSKQELALEYLLMKISSNPEQFNELIDENLHGVLHEIFDRERLGQIFFWEFAGSLHTEPLERTAGLSLPVSIPTNNNHTAPVEEETVQATPAAIEAEKETLQPVTAVEEKLPEIEETDEGDQSELQSECLSPVQSPLAASATSTPSRIFRGTAVGVETFQTLPLRPGLFYEGPVSADVDEWVDDDDAGFICVYISEKEFGSLEEQYFRHRASKTRALASSKSSNDNDGASRAVASGATATQSVASSALPMLAKGQSTDADDEEDYYESAHGSDFEEDLIKAYSQLEVEVAKGTEEVGPGVYSGSTMKPATDMAPLVSIRSEDDRLASQQTADDDEDSSVDVEGEEDDDDEGTDGLPSQLSPQLSGLDMEAHGSQVISPTTGLEDMTSPKSTAESGIAAAVWPRQAHEFAFSQENDGDSDEAYSENDVMSSVADGPDDESRRVSGAIAMDRESQRGFRNSQDSIALSEQAQENSNSADMATSANPVPPATDPKLIYETFPLKIVHRPYKTGFEESKDFKASRGSVIAGRYRVDEFLGEAAFSTAYQCEDLELEMPVCIKVIKNNKDFFDQSLDEVKLLRYLNTHGDADKFNFVRLFDYFYHREHLFIVCELLRDNLYEFSKYNRECGDELYFTLPRLRKIAKQCLEALSFIHKHNIMHCDLKPENILVKSYSRCEVKIINFGSSCFTTDHLSSYIQSRSYRAPEVIIGAPYDQKIDIWSLGCILAELLTGRVLLQNDSLQTLLARAIAMLGPVPEDLMLRGKEVPKFFTLNDTLYEQAEGKDGYVLLYPKRTSLRHRVRCNDELFLDFLSQLLQIDPNKRVTADMALRHPWITQESYD